MQELEKLGLPYMGSKRKLAKPIVDYILQQNPKCKYFYDLFGGGGAVSFYACQKVENIIYNELNTGVVELLKKIKKEGVTEEFLQWIDRETFNKHKNDSDWFGGFCKVVWSFGNNQKDYLFSKNIEETKRKAHFYLLENGYKGNAQTRLKLLKEFREKEGLSVEQLERLQQLEQLEQLAISSVLSRITLLNKSYDEVEITTPVDETIIYLDPPYFNTKKYALSIDHEELYNYIKNSKYKIYLSGYDSEFYEVKSFKHLCSLSAKKSFTVTEKLFCNRKQEDF